MNCRICHADSPLLFRQLILGRYEVAYYRCDRCEFMQTEFPYWLAEAYGDRGIAAMDTGLVQRNLRFATQTERLIHRLMPQGKRFLDFGGGTGLLVRLMRDRGFAFYRSDRYTPNLFCRGFDQSDLPAGTRFDLITAFEVLEHLPEPLIELREMLSLGDSLLFSTELQPHPAELFHWSYLFPQSGQHIAFYSDRTLQYLAQTLHCQVFSNGHDLHFLTRRPWRSRQVLPLLHRPLGQRGKNWLQRQFRRQLGRVSLVDADLQHMAEQIRSRSVDSGSSSSQSSDQ